MSKAQKEVWQRQGYKEKISKIRKEGGSRKKKILNKREFLIDIKNSRNAKELYKKYDMTATTLNVRIKEILGSLGITHYSNAKAFLQDKDIE